MNTQRGDVMIHVHEDLTADQLRQLESGISQAGCAASAQAVPDSGHMILVSFDPQCTSMDALLQVVRDQGFRADLVGL